MPFCSKRLERERQILIICLLLVVTQRRCQLDVTSINRPVCSFHSGYLNRISYRTHTILPLIFCPSVDISLPDKKTELIIFKLDSAGR